MRMMTDARDLDTGEVRPEPYPEYRRIPAPHPDSVVGRSQAVWDEAESEAAMNANAQAFLAQAAPLQPAEDDWIDAQAAAKVRLVSEAMDKVLAETERLQQEIATTPVHRPAQAQPAQAQPYELSVGLRIAMAIACFFALIGVLATFAFFAQQIVNLW